jgi:hypothetical protein
MSPKGAAYVSPGRPAMGENELPCEPQGGGLSLNVCLVWDSFSLGG